MVGLQKLNGEKVEITPCICEGFMVYYRCKDNKEFIMSKGVKTIVSWQTDQSAIIVGVDMCFRHKDGYPWSIYDCIRWCKENDYDYIVKEY